MNVYSKFTPIKSYANRKTQLNFISHKVANSKSDPKESQQDNPDSKLNEPKNSRIEKKIKKDNALFGFILASKANRLYDFSEQKGDGIGENMREDSRKLNEKLFAPDHLLEAENPGSHSRKNSNTANEKAKEGQYIEIREKTEKKSLTFNQLNSKETKKNRICLENELFQFPKTTSNDLFDKSYKFGLVSSVFNKPEKKEQTTEHQQSSKTESRIPKINSKDHLKSTNALMPNSLALDHLDLIEFHDCENQYKNYTPSLNELYPKNLNEMSEQNIKSKQSLYSTSSKDGKMMKKVGNSDTLNSQKLKTQLKSNSKNLIRLSQHNEFQKPHETPLNFLKHSNKNQSSINAGQFLNSLVAKIEPKSSYVPFTKNQYIESPVSSQNQNFPQFKIASSDYGNPSNSISKLNSEHLNKRNTETTHFLNKLRPKESNQSNSEQNNANFFRRLINLKESDKRQNESKPKTKEDRDSTGLIGPHYSSLNKLNLEDLKRRQQNHEEVNNTPKSIGLIWKKPNLKIPKLGTRVMSLENQTKKEPESKNLENQRKEKLSKEGIYQNENEEIQFEQKKEYEEQQYMTLPCDSVEFSGKIFDPFFNSLRKNKNISEPKKPKINSKNDEFNAVYFTSRNEHLNQEHFGIKRQVNVVKLSKFTNEHNTVEEETILNKIQKNIKQINQNHKEDDFKTSPDSKNKALENEKKNEEHKIGKLRKANSYSNIKKEEIREKIFSMVNTDSLDNLIEFLRKFKKEYSGLSFTEIINMKDLDNDRGLIHYALIHKHLNLLNCLIDLRADFHLKDKKGVIPLMISAAINWSEGEGLVIENTHDFNIQDLSGNTALHIAVAKSNIEFIEKLLQGSNINVRQINSKQMKPLDLAEVHMVVRLQGLFKNYEKNKR